jgi:F-type H+-transporting ATPase subunit gamma
MNPRKLKRKLISYIKFKELAKSIKLIALSQLSYYKKKISTRGLPLSSIMPFFDKRYYAPEYTKCLILPVGVDKSCCGPHNGNVFKRTDKLMEFLVDLNKTAHVFTVGNRTKDYFKKYHTHNFVGNVYNTDKEPLSLTISSILAEKILELMNYDKFYYIFNRYYTPSLQRTKVYELGGIMPFYAASLNLRHNRKQTMALDFFYFLYNFDMNTLQGLLDDIYYHSFSMITLDVLEENEYSSLGARVTAMDNSQQNAIKVIDLMTLLYNKARQASITNESIEIVSAANFV